MNFLNSPISSAHSRKFCENYDEVINYGRLLFLIISLTAVLAAGASAFVDIKVTASLQNFTTAVYNCNDADCSSVSTFTGQLMQGNTTSNGTLTIRLPSSLATTYGYALYFVSKGYVPQGYVTTYNNGGSSTVVNTTLPLTF